MRKRWFSARVRLVGYVDDGEATIPYHDSIHVFRASDWDDAFERALALGRSHEERYVNANGDEIRWRLKEVLSLDLVARNRIDGAEVHCMTGRLAAEERNSEGVLDPEGSNPGQTV
jgi:PAS domain-containing protein